MPTLDQITKEHQKTIEADPEALLSKMSPTDFDIGLGTPIPPMPTKTLDQRAKDTVSIADQQGISLGEAEQVEAKQERIKQGFLERTGKAWERGGEAVDVDFIWSQAFTGDITRKEASARTKEFEDKFRANPIEGRNWAERLWLKTVAIARPMVRGERRGIETGVITGIGAGVLGQLGPQAALPEELITVPVGFGMGHQAGALSYWAQQGTGSIYREALDQGVTEKTAKTVASIGGPIYGAIEFSQVNRLLPGVGMAKRTLVRTIIKYLGNVAWEVSEEAQQKAITDGSTIVGKLVDGLIGASDVPGELKKTAVNSYNEAKEAIGPMSLLMLPGTGVEYGLGKVAGVGVEKKPGEPTKPTEAVPEKPGEVAEPVVPEAAEPVTPAVEGKIEGLVDVEAFQKLPIDLFDPEAKAIADEADEAFRTKDLSALSALQKRAADLFGRTGKNYGLSVAIDSLEKELQVREAQPPAPEVTPVTPVEEFTPEEQVWLKEHKTALQKVLETEKDREAKLTPEEKELWEKDWMAFSKQKGYTEQEIQDYQNYIKSVETGQALGFTEDFIFDIDRQLEKIWDLTGRVDLAELESQWRKKPTAEEAPLAEPVEPEPIPTADYEETRKTLLGELKLLKKIRITEREPAVARLRKRQAGRATKIKKRLLKQGVPIEEATRRSVTGFKDVAEVPEYAPPDLTPEQWRALSAKASEVYPDPSHVFENRNAQAALDNLQRGEIITDAQILLLRQIIGEEAADQLARKMQSLTDTPAKKAQRKWDIILDIIQFAKTPANYDPQFVRQGFSFLVKNPVKYFKGIGKNIAGYLSKDYAENLLAATRANPNHVIARQRGVNFRDVGMGAEKTARLEQFRGDLPYRMAKWGKYRGPVLYRLLQPMRAWGSVLLASERGAVASINSHLQELWNKRTPRWETMERELASETLTEEEKDALSEQIIKEQRAFAETINVAMKIWMAKSSTGKEIQRAANMVLWSPAFTASRFIRPVRVLTSSGSRAYAASIVASSIGATFMVGSLISLAANLFRDEDDKIEVELDPRSSKWNRFKIGDTWFDLGAGEIQHYRFLAQALTGEIKTQSGRIIEVPRWTTVKRLAETKGTALIGIIHELATGYDIFGNPAFELPELEKLREEGTMTADAYADFIEKSEEYAGADKAIITTRYIADHVLPFFVGSFFEAAIMDGWPIAVAAGAVEALALQASSYKVRAKAELDVMQDELAHTLFGTTWRKTTLAQKIEITEDVEGLKEKMVQIYQERLAGEPFRMEFPTEKQEEVRQRMQKAMPTAVRAELKSLGLEVGGVGRKILGFYLNEEEFEQYVSQSEEQIKTDLDYYFASSEYRGIGSKADKREATRTKIDNAKAKVLKRLKSEWNVD